uniref:NDK domain-containing protein n=1 Tax=Macrostomum lignano TaxID=282301 RepID=A0A1I8I541_9PLAT
PPDRIQQRRRRDVLKAQVLASLRESPSCLAGAASLEDLFRLVPLATLETALTEHGKSGLQALLPELQLEGRRLAFAEVHEWLLERSELVPVLESGPTDEDVRRAAKLMKRDTRCSNLLQLLRPDKAKDIARVWFDLPNDASACRLRPCADYTVPEALTEHHRGQVSVPQLLLLGQPQLVRQFKRACRHLRQQPGCFHLPDGSPPLQVEVRAPTLAQLRQTGAGIVGASNVDESTGADVAGGLNCVLLYSGDSGSLEEARSFVHSLPALRDAALAYEEESAYESLGPGSPAHNQLTQPPQQPPTPPHQQQSETATNSRIAVCCLSPSTDDSLLSQGRQLAASIRARHLECQQPPSQTCRQSPTSDDANSSTSSSPIVGQQQQRRNIIAVADINDSLKQLAEDCLTRLLPAAVEAAGASTQAASTNLSTQTANSTATPTSGASTSSSTPTPSSALLVALVCGDPDIPCSIARLLAALPVRRSAQLHRVGHDSLLFTVANTASPLAAAANGSGPMSATKENCMLLIVASFHRAWRILRQPQQQHQSQPTRLLIVYNSIRRASYVCAKQFATAVASGPRTPYLLVNVGPKSPGNPDFHLDDYAVDSSILSNFVIAGATAPWRQLISATAKTVSPASLLMTSGSSGGSASYYQPCPDDADDHSLPAGIAAAGSLEPQYYTPLGDGDAAGIAPVAATMPEVYASPPDCYSMAAPGFVGSAAFAPGPPPDSTYSDALNALPDGNFQMVGSAKTPAAAAAAAAAAAGSVNPAFTGDELEARFKQSGRHQLRHQPSKRDGAAPAAIPPLSWSQLPLDNSASPVPACLSACVAYIEANGGLATEGVYRTCGNAYDIADTVSLLLSQPAELANRGPSLCTVTSALKQIIGKLTPPLLPERLLPQLAQLCQLPVQLGELLRAELDPFQLACLKRLARHLHRLAAAH